MSTETDEYLRGLYNWDEEQAEGPHVNWTNGFEASEDEYEEFRAEEGSNTPNAGGWWRFWDKD
jgi:hypothetical protein